MKQKYALMDFREGEALPRSAWRAPQAYRPEAHGALAGVLQNYQNSLVVVGVMAVSLDSNEIAAPAPGRDQV